MKTRVISEGRKEQPRYEVWEGGRLGGEDGLAFQLPGKQDSMLPFSVWHFKRLFNVLGQKILFQRSIF